jgi:light-regulated signal transduction histidine kinase (bacteriophytochrome)
MKRLALEAYENLHEERKGHTINFNCDELPYCTGDPALLSQVWTNLISNAIKFSGKRDPAEIKIHFKKTGSDLIYSVADNGTGFDMRYMAKLFGVFERLHHSEDYAGTGVGLAIVKRIITRHGGRVWVEAKENEGATFFFTTNGATP